MRTSYPASTRACRTVSVPRLQVDVAPAQAEDLAAAQPVQRQPPARRQPVRVGRPARNACTSAAVHVSRLRGACCGRLDVLGGVPGRACRSATAISSAAVSRPSVSAHRPGRQPGPSPAAAAAARGQHPRHEALDVGRADALQVPAAEPLPRRQQRVAVVPRGRARTFSAWRPRGSRRGARRASPATAARRCPGLRSCRIRPARPQRPCAGRTSGAPGRACRPGRGRCPPGTSTGGARRAACRSGSSASALAELPGQVLAHRARTCREAARRPRPG